MVTAHLLTRARGLATEVERLAAAPIRVDCLHCGLTIPRQRRGRDQSFCCEGCRRVRELIEGAGLERFYAIRRGVSAPPPDFAEESFAWLERLLESARALGTGPIRIRLAIQGIHCSACLWLLQELFRRKAGALDICINPARGEAELLFDDSRFDLFDYLREAKQFGYRFVSPRETSPPGSRALLVRLGVCVALTMNLMIVSLSFYFGLAAQDGALYPLFGAIALALGTVVVGVGGSLFFARAIGGLRRGVVSLDLPIATGVALVYATSVHAHITRGPEHAYFDSLAAFVTLMVLGRWLQERLLERNRATSRGDDVIHGMTTRRIVGGSVRFDPSAVIQEGDELCIVPGEIVPVECVLAGEHSASFALSWITGEPAPRAFEPGERVPAGAVNAGTAARSMLAAEPFGSSRLLSLLRPGLDANRRTESFGAWRSAGIVYVGAVIALAVTGFLVWLPHGFSRAAAVATSILVVTCPCAIGLATPLANDLALGLLRRRGVLVRREGFFERATRVRRIFFDKTGTLTGEHLELRAESRAAVDRIAQEDRRALFTLSMRSNHPVSRSLAAFLESASVDPLEEGPCPVREVPGRGLEWRSARGIYRLGRADFASCPPASCGPDAPPTDAAWFTRDREPLAIFEFEETVRPDAAEEIRELRRLGYEIHLLSGDGPVRALRAAKLLGIEESHARHSLGPEEKAESIRRLDRDDTLMVGDGLNDAPGFDVSLCAATPALDRPVLPSRVDFVFLGEGIAAVRLALLGARRLAAVMRTNLVLSLSYNAAALALCFAGFMNPVLAAILMPASSLGVVALTTMRMRREEPMWR